MSVDAKRMITDVTFLKDFFSTTRTHYYEKKMSEDGQLTIYHIWCAGAPSTDFNDATNGSLYTDTTNYKLYIKTAAATWTVVGAQTT